MLRFWRNLIDRLLDSVSRIDWSQAFSLKSIASLAVIIIGLNYITGLPPRTPENFRAFLEQEGYSKVNDIAPQRGFYCAKMATRYTFTATNSEGRRVSGGACMTAYQIYSINESPQ